MKESKNIIVIIIILILIISGLIFISTMQKPQEKPIPEDSLAASAPAVENPLQIIDLKTGVGKEAKEGNKIKVNYLGTLVDGQKFDSSYDRGVSFEFTLGAGDVISGWDKGLLGMKIGGKRKLIIPPSLAYGETGAPGAIPPNATLIFEIELLDVQ